MLSIPDKTQCDRFYDYVCTRLTDTMLCLRWVFFLFTSKPLLSVSTLLLLLLLSSASS